MARPRPYRDLLSGNRSFRRLWVAQLISLGGDWFNVVALTGLLLRLTGSATAGGAVLAASFAPQFLLSPLAGVVADRVDRRRLMIGANLAGATLALAMLAVRSRGQVWLGLLAMAGISSTGAFFDPASRAGLPNIVEAGQLAPASVAMSSTWGIMAAAGAAVGGLVAGLAGRDVAFVANAASFLVSAGLILGVRGQLGPAAIPPAQCVRFRPARDLREGVAFARSDGRVAALLAQKIVFGLGTGMIGLLPIFAIGVFRGGGLPADAAIGVLYAARGLGSLLGPFAARAFIGGELRRLFPVLGGAMGLFGAAYAAFGAAPGLWVAAALVLVAHLGGGTQATMTGYGLQQLAPDAVRGRVLSLELALITCSMSVSLLAAGWAAAAVSPRLVVEVLAGVTLLAAGAWAVGTRRLWRRIDGETSHDELALTARIA